MRARVHVCVLEGPREATPTLIRQAFVCVCVCVCVCA